MSQLDHAGAQHRGQGTLGHQLRLYLKKMRPHPKWRQGLLSRVEF